jgi:hypothetical protein
MSPAKMLQALPKRAKEMLAIVMTQRLISYFQPDFQSLTEQRE